MPSRFWSLASALLLACSSTEANAPLTGDWVGFNDAIQSGISLALVETSGGDLSGSGVLVAAGNFNVTVTGSHTGNTVAFTMTSGLHSAASFQGTVTNRTTITGRLTGSGFAGDALTLYKGP